MNYLVESVLKPLLPVTFRRKMWWGVFKRMKLRFRPKHRNYKGGDQSVLQCMIAYNTFGGYCIPLSSKHTDPAQAVIRGRVHEPDAIEFIKGNCGDGDVVHAGVYFGDFLPGLSRGISSGAKIWAFEPNKENYDCAVITKRLNSLDNVQIMNAGLGEYKSVQKMLVTNKGVTLGGGCRVTERLYPEGTYMDVDIVSIDETIPASRNISIIQLDVEQYEKQVLMGAMKTIARCKPTLILEVLPEKAVLETLFSLGYSIAGKVHDDTVLVHNRKPLNFQ